MGIISRDIGIDLGTSNIRVCVKGRGKVLSEPSVVAINKITNEVLAVGVQAKEMLGRTPSNIIALRPLVGGVIADFNATKMIIQNMVTRLIPKSLLSKPRLVISVPSGITDVEERAVEGVAYKAGAKEVYLIEEVMAAAIGAGIKVEQPEGSMIVDIGGGTSEMAVLSLGGIVVSNSGKFASDKLDTDIVDYIRHKFNVIIAITEAEEIKKQIGSATSGMTEEKMNVKGRNLTTGLPQTITVTTNDINEAIIDTLNRIVNLLKITLEQTPPELAADLVERGIVLSGGGSQLKNLDRFIASKVGIPVFMAEYPEECVVRGINATLENIGILKKATKTRKK